MANLSSILNKPSSAVEKPKPWPVGSYIGVIQGPPRIDKSTKKQTEFSEYIIKPTMPLGDVDPEALQTFGGMGQKTIKVTFYHTEDSLYRLRDFFDHCDIPREDENGEELSMAQRMMLVPNRQVGISVKHSASDDGETIYSNVDKTFAPE